MTSDDEGTDSGGSSFSGSSVDDSDVSYSSDDSSIGDCGASMMAIIGSTGKSLPRMATPKRSKSTNNLLSMQLEADIDMGDPKAMINFNEDQAAALAKFMTRMENVEDAYFQKPLEADDAESTKNKPRKSSSSGALDDIRKNAMSQENPVIFFEDMIESVLPRTKRDLMFTEKYWNTYFLPVTQRRRDAYKAGVVQATRDQDLVTLQKILAAEGDSSMEAVNAQGETLLHHTMRRRNHECVKFLILTAHVSVKVRDDFGKTPMHELCWYTEQRNPSQFDSLDFLMVLAPELWFAKDKRGYTPLQYAPKACWKDWCRYLSRHKESIRERIGRINV